MYTFCLLIAFFFFKQKTAYEMRISDWSSDVCSSDLAVALHPGDRLRDRRAALVQALGDPGAQRDDVLLDQLVDGSQVHLGGVDQEIGRASCRERVCQYV